MNRSTFAAALCSSLASFAQARDGGVLDIADVSLEELLETKVSVASATGAVVTSAESPGVVTVITREEIRDMGARDLIDVLRFVPGFDFNSDVENTVGLSVRGIWALEGKALVLIDGMPYNDLEYGNALLGNREPVDLIERIEIIRGPGSAVYGGFAALAVINIVTRPEKPVNRVIAATAYGQMPRAVGHANASLLGNYSFGELNVHAHAFSGYALRSDRPYPEGETLFDMARDSEMSTLNVGFGFDWRGLSFNLMYDDYFIEAPVGEAPEAPILKHHRTGSAQLKYAKALTDWVSLNVYARYLFQSPWQANSSRDLELGYYSDKRIHRAQLGASATLRPSSWLSVLLGVEGTYDTAIAQPHGNQEVDDYNAYIGLDGMPTPQLTFFNFAAFAEGTVVTPVVNITAGARLDYHSAYGPTIVPRVALTKELGRFHFKALAARAFRAPVFENISYGTYVNDEGATVSVKPEFINVFELEAGLQIAKGFQIAANVFDNRVSPTMLYQEVGIQSVYANGGTTGTHGIEVDVRARGSWGYATLGYTFYEATVRGVPQFLVEGHPELFLGVPQHRLTLHGSLKVNEHLAINPAVIVYSDRYGLEAPLGGDDVLTHFGPTALADLFLVWHDAGAKGFDVTFGVHDLFGSGYHWVSAYNSGVNALPAPGTEVMLKLIYLNDFTP